MIAERISVFLISLTRTYSFRRERERRWKRGRGKCVNHLNLLNVLMVYTAFLFILTPAQLNRNVNIQLIMKESECQRSNFLKVTWLVYVGIRFQTLFWLQCPLSRAMKYSSYSSELLLFLYPKWVSPPHPNPLLPSAEYSTTHWFWNQLFICGILSITFSFLRSFLLLTLYIVPCGTAF